MVDFKLDNVVPWGRSLQDYIQMFNLSQPDLQKSIIDCAGGPASFNAEQYQAGKTVISCDPIYQFTTEQIRDRIDQTYPLIIKGLETNYHKFVWQDIKSPEDLGNIRMSAMNKFLADFDTGLQQKRYRKELLPNLNFADHQFDIALCSHLLFSYSEQFSLDFHLQSIIEMCRVAKDVRIFPLLENFTGETSPFVEPVLDSLRDRNYEVKIEQVKYEFQINGNQILRIMSRNHNTVSSFP